MSQKNIIDISTATFLKLIFFVLLAIFAYIVWDILTLLFVAIILSFLIDPLADWAAKKHIPRGVTVFLTYFIALIIFAGIIASLAPAVIDQFSNLSNNLGNYWNVVLFKLESLKALFVQYGLWDHVAKVLPDSLYSGINTAQKLVGSVVGIFDGIASLVLVLVITFYLVVEENGFRNILHTFTPVAYRDEATRLWEKIKEKLGCWLRGQLFLDFIVGVLSYVGLLILDVQYALLLGVLAGIFETIPYAGPIFTAIVAIFLTFLQTGDWFKPFLVLILFVIIQQLENNFLVPKIMQKAIGVNPIASIISLMIGYRLFGVVGALLALPILAVISLLWEELMQKHFSK